MQCLDTIRTIFLLIFIRRNCTFNPQVLQLWFWLPKFKMCNFDPSSLPSRTAATASLLVIHQYVWCCLVGVIDTVFVCSLSSPLFPFEPFSSRETCFCWLLCLSSVVSLTVVVVSHHPYALYRPPPQPPPLHLI